MDSDETPAPANQSWGQRNALTIMLVVMGLMFAIVVIVQTLS